MELVDADEGLVGTDEGWDRDEPRLAVGEREQHMETEDLQRR